MVAIGIGLEKIFKISKLEIGAPLIAFLNKIKDIEIGKQPIAGKDRYRAYYTDVSKVTGKTKTSILNLEQAALRFDNALAKGFSRGEGGKRVFKFTDGIRKEYDRLVSDIKYYWGDKAAKSFTDSMVAGFFTSGTAKKWADQFDPSKFAEPTKLGPYLENAWKLFTAAAQFAWSKATFYAVEAIETIKETISDIWSGIELKIDGLWMKVTDVVIPSIFDKIKELLVEFMTLAWKLIYSITFPLLGEKVKTKLGIPHPDTVKAMLTVATAPQETPEVRKERVKQKQAETVNKANEAKVAIIAEREREKVSRAEEQRLIEADAMALMRKYGRFFSQNPNALKAILGLKSSVREASGAMNGLNASAAIGAGISAAASSVFMSPFVAARPGQAFRSQKSPEVELLEKGIKLDEERNELLQNGFGLD